MSPRLLMLPIEKINESLPKKGIIYDIGCGKGSVSALLANTSKERKVVGVDLSKEKIAKARKIFLKKNVFFKCADALDFSYQKCSGAILSDFLHHIPFDKQEELIKRLSASMQKNAVLVIKEIDKSEQMRMLLSRLWDFILYPMDKIYYRTKTQWINLLQANGFSVSASSQVLWFPGSTTLFVCTKK